MFPTGSLKRRILFLFIPIIIWAGLYALRGPIMELPCKDNWRPCHGSLVNPIDSWVVGLRSSAAVRASDKVQNISGGLALLAPIALHFANPVFGWASVAAETLLFLEVAIWNGAINDSVRLVVQRPRPYVYWKPHVHGNTAHDYTSFYSGHTSFTALCWIFLALLLFRNKFSIKVWIATGVLGVIAVSLVGAFRIMGGQHFLTDVLASPLMAGMIFYIIYKRKSTISSS